MVNHFHCPACLESSKLSHIILSELPPGAQYFSEQKSAHSLLSARLSECHVCGHFFLQTAPVTYYKSVIRSTNVSPSIQKYRSNQFLELKNRFFPESAQVHCLEIGAASGDYARLITDIMGTCVAAEASAQDRYSDYPNLTWVETHPDDDDFEALVSTKGLFDFVFCFSYLEHLPDPFSALNKAKKILKPGGKMLIEVPNSSLIIKNSLVNEIIPDHLHYFTAASLHRLAQRASLNLISLTTVWSDYITSALFEPDSGKSILDFASAQDLFRKNVDDFLLAYPPSVKIAVWGAGHQALFAVSSTTLHQRISFFVDSAPSKQGRFAPGLSLLVHSPEILSSSIPDLIIVACAGYNKEVIAQIRALRITSDIFTLEPGGIAHVD